MYVYVWVTCMLGFAYVRIRVHMCVDCFLCMHAGLWWTSATLRIMLCGHTEMHAYRHRHRALHQLYLKLFGILSHISCCPANAWALWEKAGWLAHINSTFNQHVLKRKKQILSSEVPNFEVPKEAHISYPRILLPGLSWTPSAFHSFSWPATLGVKQCGIMQHKEQTRFNNLKHQDTSRHIKTYHLDLSSRNIKTYQDISYDILS